MNLSIATRFAEEVKAELQPFCTRIEIAGSIRRQRSEVNDIDIVLIPKFGVSSMGQIVARCEKSCLLVRGDSASQNITFRLGSKQIDIFVAHAGIEDLLHKIPSNWGAVFLCRTGSVRHNAQLCEFAKSKGLKFAPYVGITDGENILGSSTEEEIYGALGLKWRDPTEREEL